MTRPKILYKYRPLSPDSAFNNTMQMLSRSEAYFSSPDDLNDPFECQTQVLVGEDMAPLEQRNDAELLQHNRSVMRGRLRIFSMSANYNNSVMWAHYADGHRGICVGLSTETDCEWFGLAEPVRYTDELPVVDLTSQGSPAKNFESIALCKEARWSYEQEWRIPSMEPIKVREFPPHLLVEVILGCEISEEHSMRIVRDLMLRSIRHPAVRLYRAERSSEDYSVGRRDLGLADGRSAVDSAGIMDVEAMVDLSLNLLA
jgi:hypothetical protein